MGLTLSDISCVSCRGLFRSRVSHPVFGRCVWQQAQQAGYDDQPGGGRHSGDFRMAGGVVSMGVDDPEASPSMSRSMTM